MLMLSWINAEVYEVHGRDHIYIYICIYSAGLGWKQAKCLIRYPGHAIEMHDWHSPRECESRWAANNFGLMDYKAAGQSTVGSFELRRTATCFRRRFFFVCFLVIMSLVVFLATRRRKLVQSRCAETLADVMSDLP